ncbi:MAG TPA: NAD(P)H-hydrate dehydratase [Thermoprotei archaeon]|nr:NAD(P)H-hydrate dehydratase [Thermoprotei archaeon]
MDTITSIEMRILEKNAFYLGLPPRILMESAGKSVAENVTSGKNILVVAGLGNNGGDGFVAARYLASIGKNIDVLLIGRPDRIRSEEARENFEILKRMEYSINIHVLTDSSMLQRYEYLFEKADVIIDAIFGTGIKGKIREPYASVIKKINSSKALKISVDIPSGLDPDTGEIHDICVKPDITVTFHKVKTGLTKNRKVCGKIIVANIGIPTDAEFFVGPGDVKAVLPIREPYSKKGDFGKILVIGGSYKYSGAPALTGLAALRTGADIVIIAVPSIIANTVRTYSPNLIVYPLDGEYLTKNHIDMLLKLVDKVDVVAIGPGLGLNEETKNTVIEFLSKIEIPVVVDADGLKALAGKLDIVSNKKVVLTPHAGEFKILTGIKLPNEEKNGWKKRMEIVRNEAKNLGITILLKAHYDIISNGVKVKVNRTGNPGMTVGGTGDVLTGITATFLAWNNEPFKAAVAAAFINGLAGDLVFQKKGYHILASDLIEMLPEAFSKIREYGSS